MKFDPIPHLIGLATAANVGSTGTITGNPQNIYIGVHSGISYLRFATRLLPVAMLGLGLTYLVVCLVYRSRLAAPKEQDARDKGEASAGGGPRRDAAVQPCSRAHARLQVKAVTVTMTALALFFTGLPLELVALGAAAVLLLDRIKPAKLYRQVDWSLLVMFTGLFIVVHAFQVHVVSRWWIENWQWLLSRPVVLLSVVSAGLSNLVTVTCRRCCCWSRWRRRCPWQRVRRRGWHWRCPARLRETSPYSDRWPT
ncbi:MAG: SLC13 family permease [Thermoguttaceae bacterium]